MAARLRYPELAPDGYAALSAFGHYVNTATTLEPVMLGLVYLRASVLNGCHFCIEMHKAELRKHHEPESRIDAVAEGPASEAFTGREKAALRWTEVITRLGSEGAPDEEFAAIGEFFSGKDLVDLTFAIANINAWNRMGVAFRPAWRSQAGRPVQDLAGASAAAETTGATTEAPRAPGPTTDGGGGASDKAAAEAPDSGESAEAGGTAAAHEDDGGKVGDD